MQDFWYGDKLDLIKWGVLLWLAEHFDAGRILQVAFNPRTMKFGRLIIDGEEHDVPPEVIAHFRNLRTIGSISSKTQVTVFDPMFQERASHLEAVLDFLSAFRHERCIVFLDPDTGLQPQKQKPTQGHVLMSEARKIWDAMKAGDVFAFYQHETNKAGQDWIGPKQSQLAKALEALPEAVKVAKGPSISRVVAIFYAQRPDPAVPHH
jgi:hypothetical protein